MSKLCDALHRTVNTKGLQKRVVVQVISRRNRRGFRAFQQPLAIHRRKESPALRQAPQAIQAHSV